MFVGPYKVNGVPLRRVNQAYVIATSSKIDISGAALPEVDDAYFKREKASGKNKDQEEFFAQSAAVCRLYCTMPQVKTLIKCAWDR